METEEFKKEMDTTTWFPQLDYDQWVD
jgi:hypothetical protein